MKAMNRRQQINKILHDHIDVDKNTDYTNYKKLITAIEEWHKQQVNSVDLADVGERKPTYNDGIRKELETLKEKRDAALSSSAIRYWEREIQRVKKRLYG